MSERKGLLAFDESERRALRYCTYCPKLCRHACPVAHGSANEAATPWAQMRLLYLLDQGHLELNDELFESLYLCVSCGRCQSYCNHHVPVAEILQKSRARLLEMGFKVPASFKAALGYCQPSKMLVWKPEETSRPAFLPSCGYLADGADEESLRRALQVLEVGGAGLSVPSLPRNRSCGFEYFELGQEVAARRAWVEFTAQAAPYTACVTDCGQALFAFHDQPSGASGPVMHLVEWLRENLERLPRRPMARPIAVHDAAFESRRLGLGGALREIVERLTGQRPRALYEHGQEARSTGAEGIWAAVDPVARARATRMVAVDVLECGAELVVTASLRCRNALRQGLEELSGDQAPPVEVVGIMELLDKVGWAS